MKMAIVTLNLKEVLTYTRTAKVEVPDNISEEKFNDSLDRASRGEVSADDFLSQLQELGYKVVKWCDNDLESPSEQETECEDYYFDKEEA